MQRGYRQLLVDRGQIQSSFNIVKISYPTKEKSGENGTDLCQFNNPVSLGNHKNPVHVQNLYVSDNKYGIKNSFTR